MATLTSAPDAPTVPSIQWVAGIRGSLRRILLVAAVYELLFSVVLIAVPIVILLVQIDTLYPLSLMNAPVLWTLGGFNLLMIVLQVGFAIVLPLGKDRKVAWVIGHMVGIFMLGFVPIGTFFGIVFLQHLRHPEWVMAEQPVDQRSDTASDGISLETTTFYTMASGLLGLFTSGIFLWLHQFILTQQVDLSYPIITTAKIMILERFGVIFFLLFCIQIVIGALFDLSPTSKWIRISVEVFGIFQIVSVGVVIQWFLMTVVTDAWVYGSFLLGIVLNPLGLYLGIGILRGLAFTRDGSH